MDTNSEPKTGTEMNIEGTTEENIPSEKPKKKVNDAILVLYVQTFLIVLAGQLLGTILMAATSLLLCIFIPYMDNSQTWATCSQYASFIGIWIVSLIFISIISKKNRPVLKTLGTAPRGNRISRFLFGLILGFGLNGLCILAAYMNGDIKLTFDAFHPFSFLLVFLCVFVQSAAEEFVCRGFLYQGLLHSYKKPAAAIIGSSLFFSLLHLGNEGVTVLSLINITVIGLFFALMVYYMDSIWCAFAVHTAWNFTQNIIFGLPNSGMVVPYSVWKLDAASARNSFAYNVGFGIEATVFSNIVVLAACLILFLWGRKFAKKPYDIWAETNAENDPAA